MPIDKKWIIISFISLAILLFIFLIVKKEEASLVIIEPEEVDQLIVNDEQEQEQEQKQTNTKIMVDVKGQVLMPGVYEMELGQRVFDVIEKAGGFLAEADSDSVNLAQILHDEMIIFVPKVGEEAITDFKHKNDGKVRVNYATKEQLMSLPGIGEQKALSILEYREQNGFFQTAQDLLNISGIGEKTLEKLQNYIIIP